MLLARSDERCAALVFDGVCQMTGLGLRVLWQLRLETGRVVAFHETITHVGYSLDALDDMRRAATGLQEPSSDDAVSWAEDRVLESLGTTLSLAELSRHYRRESVLEHRHCDYYLLPINYSGCWGFIVEKTGRVHQLGPLPIAVLLWAFDEGIDTTPRRRSRRRYDLRLEAIRDHDAATRILAEFVDQPTLEALLVPTPRLPIVLRNVDLYPALELLHEARVGDAVTFSVGLSSRQTLRNAK